MLRYIPLVLLITTLPLPPLPAEDWPEFRGPTGQGHSTAKGLPLTWSETENIVWKVPVPGLGWSSPSIVAGQLWFTTALDDGKSLRAVCLDPQSGKLIHDVEVFQKENPGKVHSKNSHASPTPLIEGKRVFVHYGAHGTACLSTDGRILWKTNELVYAHQHGPGGSPVVYKDLLILSCDGTDVQFVVALDKQTGKIRWRTDRQGQMAYSTPLVINVNGSDQVISTGGEFAAAYEPLTGKEIWRVLYPTGYSNVPRPVYGNGLVFVCSGYNSPVLYAVRPDGQGDVTNSHVAWTLDRAAPLNPSPLLIGEELYLVSDRGIATCLDAKTGAQHWQQRLPGAYSASPVHADGRIYFLNEEGEVTVIAPGKMFQSLATNQVEGRTLASLGVYGKSLYLRTATHLYRIEAGPK